MIQTNETDFCSIVNTSESSILPPSKEVFKSSKVSKKVKSSKKESSKMDVEDMDQKVVNEISLSPEEHSFSWFMLIGSFGVGLIVVLVIVGVLLKSHSSNPERTPLLI